jgi:predicted 3-demethylubiquinone-9 3-methyltransferase (glyoxalase superfamily)
VSQSVQKVTPFLWFDHQADEAAAFYTSVFPNSRVTGVTHYGEGAPIPAGTVMTVAFELDGQKFTALNGGPHFKFTEAISFVVHCDTQQEVDHFWDRLSGDGGEVIQCGWLKDKFGVTWQIVPTAFIEMMKDQDAPRKGRVMKAMMKMKKLVIADLEAAWRG